MNRIPKVVTYRIAVITSTYHVTDVLFVDAPNKILAILNARRQYPSTIGCPLIATRLSCRTIKPTGPAMEYHVEQSRLLAQRLRIKSEAEAARATA